MKTIIQSAILLSFWILLGNFAVCDSIAQDKKEAGKQEAETRDELLQSLKSMQIAYIHKGDVWVMKGDGSDKKRIIKRGDITILFGWSYDDTRLLFGTGKLKLDPGGNYISGYKLWTVEIKTGEAQQVLRDKKEAIDAAWVPQKDEIAFLAKDESLWVLNPDGSNARWVVKCCASPDSFSPDGNEIAYIKIKMKEKNEDAQVIKSDIWIENIRNNVSRQITKGGINGRPVWSPDGKRIFFQSEKSGETSLGIINSDGTKFVKIKYSKFPIAADKISPDEKYFIITSPVTDTTTIASLETGNTKRIIFDIKPYGRKVLFSPDGRYLVYVSKKNEIRIINTEGEVILRVSDGDYPYWSHIGGGEK